MDLRKVFFCVMTVFALILSTGNARNLEKRSPQEEAAEPVDHCAGGPWTNFYAFLNWCETGEVGAKAVVEE